MGNCAVSLNLKGMYPTTYWDYDFTSLAVANNSLLGSSANGLFHLDYGDTDDGAQLLAKFRTLLTDFADNHTKRIRYIILGCEAEGFLEITLIGDEQLSKTYTVDTEQVTGQHGVKRIVDPTTMARYWAVEIANVNGVDFSLDQIILGLIVQVQRFARRHRHGKTEVEYSEITIFGFEKIAGVGAVDYSDIEITGTGTGS
jgi:hypothetical protein